MDADVMITIVFTLEVFLFALVPGVVIARRAHKAKQEAAAKRGGERGEAPAEAIGLPTSPTTANELAAADASELAGGCARRAVRGVRP
jgi:hypothetical protein